MGSDFTVERRIRPECRDGPPKTAGSTRHVDPPVPVCTKPDEGGRDARSARSYAVLSDDGGIHGKRPQAVPARRAFVPIGRVGGAWTAAECANRRGATRPSGIAARRPSPGGGRGRAP